MTTDLKPPPMTLPTAGLVYMGLTGLPEHAYSAQQMRDFEAARDAQWLALVGELQRDAERLDWMEKRLRGASDSERYLPFRVYWGDGRGIRKAIDAAREKGGV